MLIRIGQFDITECWDGVFYKKLSRYPHITAWEMQTVLDFIRYEESNGRTCEIEAEKEILDAIGQYRPVYNRGTRIQPPPKIEECTACPKYRGCMTDYVCHTSSVENAVRILECGKLLSPVRARKARASELQGEARNAANDPEDYFEYIMFAWGNCQAGDRLVMERKLGRFPDEKDLSEGFAPGVRFFFRYSDLIRHPGAVFEGVLPLKVRDEILLEDWVSAVIVPEINRQQVEPSVPKELESRVHFLQNDCKDIWEWSEKVYEYVRMNDMKYRKAEKADSGRIAELFREMLRTVCHTENVEGYEDGYLDRFFSGSGDLIYVAELGKEVVAFLSVQVYREDGYIYLDDFSVTAEYRGKGIGTKLIGMAEEYSESIGIPAIVLHVDKTNERARRLYRKLGYRDHEDQGNRILMVKDLFFR